ncbi:PucR family transcriptional regulator [Neobacillus sp. SAB-20_R2A]|uniref:PucR family transcriptional regulator n=1 Tax=Neobacillus sp. SAB-20_R2A TaxID=3120519 RepID=UPI003C6E7096
MKLTLAEALTIPLLQQCEMIAGNQGLGRTIMSVNSFDAPDVMRWLKTGDLVLTTGYIFLNNEQALTNLVYDLAERNCAGLGIKTAHFPNSLPQDMILAANKMAFPIFRIPNELSIADLIQTILRELLTQQTKTGTNLQKLAVNDSHDFSTYSVLQHIPKEILKEYYSAFLSPLISHDQENHTDFLNTLEVYLNCGAKTTEAAQTIGVHRNTIHQRISKIKELLGSDLDNGKTNFRLQLAIKMYHLNKY